MGALRVQFAALIAMILFGCMSDNQLSLVVDIDPIHWREAAHFSIENSDTLSRRDISIFARYQLTKERVDSLPLHIITIAPDQTQIVEQFTIYINHKSGDQWVRRLYREELYRKDVVFNQLGEYEIMIYPQISTHGVEAIGVAIETIP
ncbi:MAG: hypothetical protein SNH55_05250 [Rikenellaceae bacterium]